MDLEAELDEVLRDAGWAGMSWDALTAKYATVEMADLKTALNRLIAKKSIYRFLRPHGTGRTSATSTLYYSFWLASTARAIAGRSAERIIDAAGA
ncbi:MAG TPA: hypothetical protein VGU20_23345 [Stellaceae bacterium]|nr:hypothetical protein [Stellaceae bacterium]